MATGSLVQTIVDEIDRRLRAAGTPERAEKERAYLKSSIEHYGVTVPAIRRETLDVLRSHRDLDHDEVVGVATGLWEVPVHERRTAAVEVLEHKVGLLGPGDIDLLERLLRESRTWALSDGLGASVVGEVVDRFPGQLGPVLDRWAVDDDFWIRRSALLALLLPLRRGAGDFDRFARYADAMLDETEFFIRKAIGWVLRDTARKRPDLVFEWALPLVARMSGVTLREVVKPLSDQQRAAIAAARG